MKFGWEIGEVIKPLENEVKISKRSRERPVIRITLKDILHSLPRPIYI